MDLFINYGLAIVALLSVASLSGLMSEKTGVVNIAIEGMMTIGALFTAILGSLIKDGSTFFSQFWIALLSMLITGVFAMLHAFPSITLKSNQVVSGTAINVFAAALGIYIVSSGTFGTTTTVITTHFILINVINDVVPVWLFVSFIVIILVVLFLKFTKQGMRYQMVGENPGAIDAAGISVVKYRYIAVFVSGCLAGLAGSIFIYTRIGNLSFNGSTVGWGFLALGIMIFGQWKVKYIFIGVLLFGILFSLGNQITMITSNDFLVQNADLFKIFPFILTIITMIIFSKKNHAPAADGVPFDKSAR